VILEGLEKQIEIRTQHLSTLYEINAAASEPLELDALLKRVLQITLESLTSQAGTIHLLDNDNQAIRLAVQAGLPAELTTELENLTVIHPFWSRLMSSSNPLVVPDLSAEAEMPDEFAGLIRSGSWAFLGAPIRAKGQVLGFISLFDRSILDYTIEEIALFTTIADQIGSLVERARLMKQAEAAAVVQERQRLARELHDSVTQLLYGQVLFAGAGLKVLHSGDSELAEQHLTRIDQAAQQALKEMRLLVYQLRPSEYLEEGLVGALRRRLEAVEKRTGINARLVVEGEISLDESQEMALYRIAEEALNNILKHAQAKTVLISLRATDSRVILEIEDDGVGFDLSLTEKAGGMGLESMRERTRSLGGEFQILSRPDHGTKIILSIEVSP